MLLYIITIPFIGSIKGTSNIDDIYYQYKTYTVIG